MGAEQMGDLSRIYTAFDAARRRRDTLRSEPESFSGVPEQRVKRPLI